MGPLVLLFFLFACVASETGEQGAERSCIAAPDGSCLAESAAVDGRDRVQSELAAVDVLPWRGLSSIEDDPRKFLECSGGDPEAGFGSPDAPQGRSIVEFCQRTRPQPDCDFDATPSEGEEAAYEDWRSECLHRCIFSTPDLHMAHIFDDELAEFLPMTAALYHSTPFLDSRLLAHGFGTCRYVAKLAQVTKVALWGRQRNLTVGGAPAGQQVRLIFHMGNVASTLLSRALGEIPETLVLREPPMLRWMAETYTSSQPKDLSKLWSEVILPWLSRRHNTSQTVLVKAKFTALSWMQPELRRRNARAVFVYSGLKTHLTIGLARPDEIFPSKLYDALHVKGAIFKELHSESRGFKELNIAQYMALMWIKRIAFAWKQPSSRVLWLRMDEFLDEPAKHLKEVATFLGLQSTEEVANSIVEGPVFKEYSMNPSVRYDASMHKQNMKERRKKFRNGIEDGIEFAKALVRTEKTLEKLQHLIEL